MTAAVVIAAAALVLFIMSSGDQKPAADKSEATRVASGALIAQQGSSEPKVVLALYEDFLCPRCRAFD